MDRNQEQLRREQDDRAATMTEPAPAEGFSTADIAAGRRDADRGGTTMPEQQGGAPDPRSATRDDSTDAATPLFAPEDAQGYRTRWTDVQTGFVDDPRHAVEQADGLVADVMKRLAESFANERSRLEQQWDRGDNVDTEDLRLALHRYRSFFDRLLSV
jgi:hypothetical protein